MPVTNKEELIEYCLGKLGEPVIEVNCSPEQCAVCIDDALQFWNEWTFDGTERVFLKAQVTASTLALTTSTAQNFIKGEKITGSVSGATAKVYTNETGSSLSLAETKGTFQNNETITGEQSNATATLVASNAFVLGSWDSGFIQVADVVTNVTNVFAINATSTSSNPQNLYSVMYQFHLNDMYSLLGMDLIYYSQVQQHLSLLNMLLPSKRSFRFNRKTKKLHVDMDWQNSVTPGTFIVAECLRYLDPADYEAVWDDMWLKKYATALIKKQWGTNLYKFASVELLGGVKINGVELYNQAQSEIEVLEQQIKDEAQLPPMFFVG